MTFPDHRSLKWKCGRCDTWNPATVGVCRSCSGLMSTWLSVVQLENVNTQLEQDFYKYSAPAVVSTLREIREVLAEIRGLISKENER